MNNVEKFWTKVDKTGRCWIWKNYITHGGYGQLKWGDKLNYAHRVAYEISFGKIPYKMVIDHLCRNRACVNPNHMELVTRGENVMRGNGLARNNLLKTHCKRGHELLPENVYLYRNMRQCRECKRMRKRGEI